MEKKEMRILITGADGFIGKNVVCALKQRGYNELFLYNRKTSERQFQDFVRDCDIIFHFAGVNRPVDEDAFFTDNVDLTKRLVQYLKDNVKSPHIIFTSSTQAVLDNPYGKSKKVAEDCLIQYVQDTNVSLTIYRLPNVFGKWCRPDYNSVVATFCYHICRNEAITINDKDAEISLVYIDDLVNELLDILKEQDKRSVQYKNVKEQYSITVGQLAKLITSFKKERINQQLPDLKNKLNQKLYSTYLSYLSPEDFKYPLTTHIDHRGSFTEFLRTDGSGQVSINISLPGIVKGNHWHHTKVEKFLVVRGEALIQFRHILTDDKTEYHVSGEKLEVVDIPVGYTHSITNIGCEELVTVMWASEPFNEKYPDTYFEEI